MTVDELVARINALARKSRESGLTDEEKEEQKQLRQEYIGLYRRSLQNTLDHTVIKEPDGTLRPLCRRPDKPLS